LWPVLLAACIGGYVLSELFRRFGPGAAWVYVVTLPLGWAIGLREARRLHAWRRFSEAAPMPCGHCGGPVRALLAFNGKCVSVDLHCPSGRAKQTHNFGLTLTVPLSAVDVKKPVAFFFACVVMCRALQEWNGAHFRSITPRHVGERHV
jgi:hypothetical protein